MWETSNYGKKSLGIPLIAYIANTRPQVWKLPLCLCCCSRLCLSKESPPSFPVSQTQLLFPEVTKKTMLVIHHWPRKTASPKIRLILSKSQTATSGIQYSWAFVRLSFKPPCCKWCFKWTHGACLKSAVVKYDTQGEGFNITDLCDLRFIICRLLNSMAESDIVFCIKCQNVSSPKR